MGHRTSGGPYVLCEVRNVLPTVSCERIRDFFHFGICRTTGEVGDLFVNFSHCGFCGPRLRHT